MLGPRPPGSSPRVRGKPGLDAGEHGRGRLIPACAGKTCGGAPRGGVGEAHPRVCGENLIGLGSDLAATGSSPRVRGKRRGLRPQIRGRGLIPACAGKTPPQSRQGWRRPAHPRVCGENGRDCCVLMVDSGSSPRVRGKLSAPPGTTDQKGLIPACAGKTQPLQVRGDTTPAHPRVCGENRGHRAHGRGPLGSSPRVRGKRVLGFPSSHEPRLIPACAGKTRGSQSATSPTEAHPRVCGENLTTDFEFDCPSGSSPRVRGKPAEGHCLALPLRLIPACAGKTVVRLVRRARGPAHPRVCGENLAGDRDTLYVEGSSPRVRGKRRTP